MSENVKYTISAVDRFSGVFGKINSSIQKSEDKLQRFGQAGKIVTGIGAGLAAGLGATVKVAATFEAGMSRVQSVTGASAAEMELLEKEARLAGASTSKSATDAADALYYLGLSGWDAQDSMKGMWQVIHLAEAGSLDLGHAADLVTDSLSALSLGVDDTSWYLDQIAQTSRNSNVGIDSLLETFLVAGGTISRFNIPMEEANALFGVMGNRGEKAGQAGTAFNAIMDNLTSGTGAAGKAMEELGISAFDSEENFIGMEETLLLVKGELDGMTDAQRAQYMSMIAGKNHGKTFQKMLDGLGDEYGDLKSDIEDSDGALLDMRDTMKDNLQGAMENLSSAFEEGAISLGSALIPMVKSAADTVQGAVDWFNRWSNVNSCRIVTDTSRRFFAIARSGRFSYGSYRSYSSRSICVV